MNHIKKDSDEFAFIDFSQFTPDNEKREESSYFQPYIDTTELLQHDTPPWEVPHQPTPRHQSLGLTVPSLMVTELDAPVEQNYLLPVAQQPQSISPVLAMHNSFSPVLPPRNTLSPALSNIDPASDLEELLSVVSGNYEDGLNVDEYQPSPAGQFSLTVDNLRNLQDVLPPTISIHEPQDLLQIPASRSPSVMSGGSYHGPAQNVPRADSRTPSLLSVGSSYSVEDESAEMVEGRRARRRSHSNPDEKARSLSQNREKLLELAEEGSNSKRQQKHPSLYACPVCDKRFTRPYNLKSHLRTHTDERPFICGVCGKAFARQHDRKRHEDLHSGKKRYVCGGTLKSGLTWGCNKKFARSDALGRHFKTESGKKCILPLVEESRKEKKTNLDIEREFPREIYEQFPNLLDPSSGGESDFALE